MRGSFFGGPVNKDLSILGYIGANVGHSLNFLQWDYIGDYIGEY